MAKTIANVLVGVATLSIRQPNDAIAEWSEPGYLLLPQSAKLLKTGSGNAGSTHVQFIPPTGITFATAMGDATQYGFAHFDPILAVNANWCHMELRFEDPNSVGWVEITCMPLQNNAGNADFADLAMVNNGVDTMCGGHTEEGVGFFDATLRNWSAAAGEIQATVNAAVGDADLWILERVRVELWEPEPARHCYIGHVTIAGEEYNVTPGGNAPGMSLGSPYTEVGYTEDGVTMEYAAEQTDIMVHEETFAIDSAITKESITITCNMAEASLANMNNAMAGAVLSGSVITIGDGVNKTMNLKVEGTNSAGFLRAIYIPKAVASGTVGMSYKKGEKTIIPVSFKALKAQDTEVCTIVDNAA